MTLRFVAIAVMCNSLWSGDHVRYASAGPSGLPCENCRCERMAGEKCPFQKCQQLWDDCLLKQYNDRSFMEEYFKQRELTLIYLSTPFRNLHEYMTFLSYPSKENGAIVTSKYKETTTVFQIFNTRSPARNNKLPVTYGTNQSFEVQPTVSFEKIIELEPTRSVLHNKTNSTHTAHEHENVLLVVDVGLVLLWSTNVIFVCVLLHCHRRDSATVHDPVLDRIRIDNVANTPKTTDEDDSISLNVYTDDAEFGPVHEPLCPIDDQCHSDNNSIMTV